MDLKQKTRDDLERAKRHLVYSFARVQAIDLDRPLGEPELETLESFSSRFARFTDLVVSRYFRLLAHEHDPAFRGSVIDLLNIAEKNDWIQSARDWRRIRALRNVAAHEYATDDYPKLYREIIRLTPVALAMKL